MGSYLSQLWSFASGGAASEVKIVIAGLNNAGKTTLLYKLALGNIVVTEPTVGSNVESVTHNGVKM
jgi:ADP-ribosylation factor-like protein 5B